ncbi:GNAT family N-acetyltransferase [bacterium]|nr:GNAT family N-acetyltransferase [bacterium]MBU1883289.1 GNAT family N-acetyltransferase [bacterium]
MKTRSDIVLTPIEPEDILTIQNWEPYPDEFSELDYALRKGGWLDEYAKKPDTDIFVAKKENEIIGFTILSDDNEGTEFRIAIKADKLGQGFGKAIASATIKKGFTCKQRSSIYLIVRVSNNRAKKLYKELGFVENGEIVKEINKKQISFLQMELQRC